MGFTEVIRVSVFAFGVGEKLVICSYLYIRSAKEAGEMIGRAGHRVSIGMERIRRLHSTVNCTRQST